MKGFPISIQFSYEITFVKPHQVPDAGSSGRSDNSNCNPKAKPKQQPCSSSLSAASDKSERSLSPATRLLQQQIRTRLTAKRENNADANSLRVLQAAEAHEQHRVRERERVSDVASLYVLLRATARCDDEEANEASPAKSSIWSSLGSSFKDVALHTPCASPKPARTLSGKSGTEQTGDMAIDRTCSWPKPARTPPRKAGSEEMERANFSSPGSVFGRSMLEEQRRRERNHILQSSRQVQYRGARSVAELMRHFEELERRNGEEAVSNE